MGSTGKTVKNGQTQDDPPHSPKMRTTPSLLLLFAAFLLAGIVSSLPQTGALGKSGEEVKTACSIDEVLKCQEEINQAMSDYGHLDTLAEITTCINDILTGLLDCQSCVCDALPQLCAIENSRLGNIKKKKQ